MRFLKKGICNPTTRGCVSRIKSGVYNKQRERWVYYSGKGWICTLCEMFSLLQLSTLTLLNGEVKEKKKCAQVFWESETRAVQQSKTTTKRSGVEYCYTKHASLWLEIQNSQLWPPSLFKKGGGKTFSTNRFSSCWIDELQRVAGCTSKKKRSQEVQRKQKSFIFKTTKWCV